MQPTLELRDIHLPETIGWWPPAFGWWILLALVLLCLYGLYRAYKKLTRKTAAKAALKLIVQIRDDEALNDLQLVEQLSALLRRIVISSPLSAQQAGLSGDAWLRHLDHSMEGRPFSDGVGRCLANAHYRRQLPKNIDKAALIQLCEDWIKKQP